MTWFHSGIESTESFEKQLDDIIAFARTFKDRSFSGIKLNDRFVKDTGAPYKLNIFMEYLYEKGMISEGRKGSEGGQSTEFYHLKMKGELFEGFVKHKKRKNWEHRRVIIESWAVIFGGGSAFLYYFFLPLLRHYHQLPRIYHAIDWLLFCGK